MAKKEGTQPEAQPEAQPRGSFGSTGLPASDVQESSPDMSWKNNLWVPSALSAGLLFGAFIPVDSSYQGTLLQARISELLGWTYFFAWSVSFWPQVVLNFQRRSVVGLSLDFQMLNCVGFVCYSAFNVLLFFSADVQKEYENSHGGHSSAVRLNDVVFSLHAVLLTCVTLCQIGVYYDYPPLDRIGKILRYSVIGSLSVFLTVAIIIAVVIFATSERALTWLTYLSILAESKVAITVVKYCPQVFLNYQRKSTVGWNIEQILLDFCGGFLSVAQLTWDGWASSDWSKVSGDPVKLLLGNLSMFFDVIFMVQHYCLYRLPRQSHIAAPLLRTAPTDAAGQQDGV